MMPARILIAEDDNLQSSVLQTALDRRGYQAETAADGLEAVCRLRTGDYDLALLDYHMPDVDGLTAARLVHDMLEEEDRPRLIGISISADELSEKQQVSGGRFFDAVVSKRIGLSALLDVIDNNLASAAESATRRRRLRLHSDGGIAGTRIPGAAARRHDVSAGKANKVFRSAFATKAQSDGQVQVISLAAFKEALGAKWDRVALRAMITAEHIIMRRLSSDDVISRSGDHSFVIWFNLCYEDDNEAIILGAIREIRLRFLTEFGEEALQEIEAM